MGNYIFGEKEPEEVTLSKGNTVIGNYGNFMIYNKITFLDINKDGIVDFVLLKKINIPNSY